MTNEDIKNVRAALRLALSTFARTGYSPEELEEEMVRFMPRPQDGSQAQEIEALAKALGTDPVFSEMMREVEALKKESGKWIRIKRLAHLAEEILESRIFPHGPYDPNR